MSRIDLDRVAIAALAGSVAMGEIVQQVGDQVADRARQSAPRDTGKGADSIRAEVVNTAAGKEAHISWDKSSFYMGFHELGTSAKSARPFLRPALDAQYEV